MTLTERCTRLPPIARRIVALLVVPLVIVLVCLAIVLPIVGISKAQERWRGHAANVVALAKHSPAIKADLEQRIAAVKTSELWSRFYEGGRTQRGATSLHADVSSLLAQAQVSAQSLTPLAAQELPHFTRIGIRCTASMRTDQLQQFIAAVARQSRYLRIDRLVVTAPLMQSPEENPALAVTLDIFGFEHTPATEREQSGRSSLARRSVP